ncbi:glycoside hydrolase superfamily [Plectosphaerella plurivora]|uniref:alpha-L-fucosidase n=1 Tax=Plectosphaerella plurivora TaxID=936078 RepID=A0A9P8VKJ2_9PEZI|nr:glycoside hydrolase superfamily [Plectosphaerella plurivora]
MRLFSFYSWLGEAVAAAVFPSEGGVERRQDQALADLTIGVATLTSKWIEESDYEQVVEMVVTNNHATSYLTWKDRLTISAESDSLDTISPGTLIRLAPKQSAVVRVGVKNKAGVSPGTRCDAEVIATWGDCSGESSTVSKTISGSCGFGNYAATENSLSQHWNPDWYNEVKFGIFIHWGIYAVPSYGNEPGPKQDYAEWYGFRMIQPDFRSETYQYHRETYGEDFNYDQFIGNFTDEFFDAKDWLDLIAGSGAQYFVPVTKHHDGWALFNQSETISRRSTVHYGPKRDFIKELMDVAKAEHPEIRRGTYFSMPEWFNPAYVEYGWDQNYQGNYYGYPPRNPYTNESIEYTGYVEVPDFLDDIQVPQMEALAYDYGTEIMWCDIGGPNKAPEFLSQWANWARDQGRQITWNNRCGIGGDWDTPEYNSGSFQTRKFESNRGMDPFSYGFNHLTKDEDYMTGEDIVIDLVSIVANNGNYLLNIGPRADGSIPETQRQNLLDAGEWIHSHGDGIFGTRYWSVARHTGNFRYVVKPEAFFIHHIGKPASQLVFTDPIPWLEGDIVVAVGGSADGAEISASRNAEGQLVLDLSDDIVNGDKYVWTFKVKYAAQ